MKDSKMPWQIELNYLFFLLSLFLFDLVDWELAYTLSHLFGVKKELSLEYLQTTQPTT